MNTQKPDELLTVKEVAEILKVSEDTVLRRFANRPGVIDIGTAEDFRGRKRGYRVLRIRRSDLLKFIMERTR